MRRDQEQLEQLKLDAAASRLLERAEWQPSPRDGGGGFSEGKENYDEYYGVGGGGGGGGGGSGFQDAAAAKHAHQQEVRNANNPRQVPGGHAKYMEERNKTLKEKIYGLSPTKKMLPAQRRALEKQQQQQQLEQDAGSPRVLIPDGWDTGSKPNSKEGALSSAIDMSAPSFDRW